MEFEEKVNIGDLVLPSNSTDISNMETIEMKEEPLEQSRSMISIHEGNTSGELIMVHERINSPSSEPYSQDTGSLKVTDKSVSDAKVELSDMEPVKEPLKTQQKIQIQNVKKEKYGNGDFEDVSKKSRSKIWEHFWLNKSTSMVRCNHCSIFLKLHRGRMHFMHFHLNSKHSITVPKNTLPKVCKTSRKCCVPKCTTNTNVKYYSIPEDTKRKQEWFDACKLPPSTKISSKICWKHFLQSDFRNEVNDESIAQNELGDLKKNVVPSQNLPEDSDQITTKDQIYQKEENNLESNSGDMLDATKNDIHKCDICENTFKSKLTLCTHERNCRLEKRAVKPLENLNIIEKHAEKFFDGGAVFHKKDFSLDSSPKKQIRQIHEVKKQVLCEICPFLQLSSTKEVMSHRRETHMKEKKIGCPYCKQSVNVWGRLKLHIDAKHPQHAEKKFSCDKCPKSFIFETSCTIHKLRAHNEIVCDICGAKFKKKQVLDNHMIAKHNTGEGAQFSCEKCEYSTISKCELAVHKKSNHDFGSHKKCPHCDYKTATNQKLNRHIDNNHSDKDTGKKHVCEKCEKSFMFESSLTDHVKYLCEHSGQCPHCDYKTPTDQILKGHIENNHSDQVIPDFCLSECSLT